MLKYGKLTEIIWTVEYLSLKINGKKNNWYTARLFFHCITELV